METRCTPGLHPKCPWSGEKRGGEVLQATPYMPRRTCPCSVGKRASAWPSQTGRSFSLRSEKSKSPEGSIRAGVRLVDGADEACEQTVLARCVGCRGLVTGRAAIHKHPHVRRSLPHALPMPAHRRIGASARRHIGASAHRRIGAAAQRRRLLRVSGASRPRRAPRGGRRSRRSCRLRRAGRSCGCAAGPPRT